MTLLALADDRQAPLENGRLERLPGLPEGLPAQDRIAMQYARRRLLRRVCAAARAASGRRSINLQAAGMQRDARSGAANGRSAGRYVRSGSTRNPRRRGAVHRALATSRNTASSPTPAAAAEALPYDCWARGNTEHEALRFLRSNAAPIMAAAVAAEAIVWGGAIARRSRRDEH
jgi:hypothetical protein